MVVRQLGKGNFHNGARVVHKGFEIFVSSCYANGPGGQEIACLGGVADFRWLQGLRVVERQSLILRQFWFLAPMAGAQRVSPSRARRAPGLAVSLAQGFVNSNFFTRLRDYVAMARALKARG